uniref:LsmAD domain-containing protein n=1 Tax=Encephalitozoon cuniculi TaxID=6035 RepID=M1K298_ENCCN|nr:hypothetical protein ECU11_1020 [Encephalitozoon cuniculi]
MDNYTIAICFKNNPSRIIGAFLSNEDGKVKLENAFFETNPGVVFPTISISESDIITVTKMNGRQAEKGKDASERGSGAKEDSGWSSFRTDSEISGGPKEMPEAVLPKAADLEKSLEEECKDWNQFEANSKLFNIDSRFDEEEYMEVLDKSSESYKSKVSMARRIEKEIMLSATTDAHRLEERGLGNSVENEDIYSSVVREECRGAESKSASAMEVRQEKVAAAKQPADDGTKRKMVIEIEGLSLLENRKDEAVSKAVSSKSEGPSSGQEEGKNGKPKKSVRYGWMHTKFDSSKNLLEMIKSKFKSVFDIGGGELKWGTGPNWEAAAKSIAKKVQKPGKTSVRKAAKKSPVSK